MPPELCRYRRVRSLHTGQIPSDWLETDKQKGLTGSEAEERRKKSGYNELERWVACSCSLAV